MNTNEALTWVRENMPIESAQALAKFTGINPHYQGGGWDDCLAILLDSDSHLGITEALYEVGGFEGALAAAVAITLLYAYPPFTEATGQEQADAVSLTIKKNTP